MTDMIKTLLVGLGCLTLISFGGCMMVGAGTVAVVGAAAQKVKEDKARRAEGGASAWNTETSANSAWSNDTSADEQVQEFDDIEAAALEAAAE